MFVNRNGHICMQNSGARVHSLDKMLTVGTQEILMETWALYVSQSPLRYEI